MNSESKAMTPAEIRKELQTNSKGAVMQTISNCMTVLKHDPMLQNAIRYNVLTDRQDIVGQLGWKRSGTAITDTDMNYLLLYFEENYGIDQEKKLQAALDIAANENQYHPIRDFLLSLEWDGQERISYALTKYLGAEETQYTEEVLKLFLLGAIHRVFEPGCKFESMLCLVGGQGAGKSSFFRLLAVKDDWFSDDLKKIDDENVYRKIKGHWIIEMSEMLATANARSIEDIKSFLSRQKETYKVPYEVHPEDRPRQCVFAGTSNSLDFLPLDRSGNRRFLPVLVNPEKAETHILEDEAESRAFICQLWAEAMVIYQSGDFRLTLSPEMQELARSVQRDFMPEDSKAGMIQSFLDNFKGSHVCSLMLYREALGNGFENPKQWELREIGEIMNQSITGWVKGPQHRFTAYGQQRSWCREPIQPPEAFAVIEEQLELPEEWE